MYYSSCSPFSLVNFGISFPQAATSSPLSERSSRPRHGDSSSTCADSEHQWRGRLWFVCIHAVEQPRWMIRGHALVFLKCTDFAFLSLKMWHTYTSKSLFFFFKYIFLAKIFFFFFENLTKCLDVATRLLRVSGGCNIFAECR